jgi:hypothetical protein
VLAYQSPNGVNAVSKVCHGKSILAFLKAIKFSKPGFAVVEVLV